MTAEALVNKYALTIDNFGFFQIKTASAFATTIRLVGHDVVDWPINLFFSKLHIECFRLDCCEANFFQEVVSPIIKL